MENKDEENVYVKTNGEWLVASVHDRDAHDMKEHSLQLEQLAWLQGDWVDEGDDAVVQFSCEPTDDGNFLLRSFSIHVAGQETMTGTQRIGWDPLTRRLRTWVFDSSGSFGEGNWKATRPDGSEFTLNMTDESKFTWTFALQGEPTQKFAGTYSIDGNILALEREEGGSLIAEVTPDGSGKFSFRMLGAPEEDKGLDFTQ